MSDKSEIMVAGNTLPSTEEVQPDIMQSIMSLAKDEAFDAEKMRVLVGMKNDHEDRESKKEFTIAMVEFSKLKPRIIKNKKGHNGSYASLDSIARQIRQPLFECGFTYNWITETNKKEIKVTCVLSHAGGHSVESWMEDEADTSGKKNRLQGAGSTTSYLERYTLKAVLGLVEEGEDDDGIKAKIKQSVDKEQASQIEGLIEETGVDLIKFCKAFDIGAIVEMDSAQFGLAVKQLNAKKGDAGHENP